MLGKHSTMEDETFSQPHVSHFQWWDPERGGLCKDATGLSLLPHPALTY